MNMAENVEMSTMSTKKKLWCVFGITGILEPFEKYRNAILKLQK